jgi:hypothetical protein
MRLRMLRTVAAIDAANVVAVSVASPRHGAAGAIGYLPALVGTILAHRRPSRPVVPMLLCVVGLVPNTLLSVAAAGPTRRSQLLSAYVAIGGLVVGAGYLVALIPRRAPASGRMST